MATIVLTAIGDDHAGLVRALAGVIARHRGNWETSRMAHLAGKFAGIVMVTVDDDHIDALISDLAPLAQQGLLDIVAERSAPVVSRKAHPQVTLELVGRDRPGIVREVSDVLARSNVNIEALDTETATAAVADQTVFKARATLSLPDAVSVDYLSEALEDLAEQLTLDVRLNAD